MRRRGPPGFGSSPRARGTGARFSLDDELYRFIPASAGNGRDGCRDGTRGAVHPRERGERVGLGDVSGPLGGSSPRARGTADQERSLRRQIRFIPASAGNGGPASRLLPMTAVHPRERGERRRFFARDLNGHGSSPRARGTERDRQRVLWCRRFIPASAGNGDALYDRSHGPAVHPRERGERVTA